MLAILDLGDKYASSRGTVNCAPKAECIEICGGYEWTSKSGWLSALIVVVETVLLLRVRSRSDWQR